MIETAVQTLVVNAVIDAGGMAMKMAHKFLMGVPDLLIKLPADRRAMIMEAKLERRAQMTRRTQHPLTPAVTVNQFNYLTKFHLAGTPAGVMSFVEVGGRGKRGLWLHISMLPQYRPGIDRKSTRLNSSH